MLPVLPFTLDEGPLVNCSPYALYAIIGSHLSPAHSRPHLFTIASLFASTSLDPCFSFPFFLHQPSPHHFSVFSISPLLVAMVTTRQKATMSSKSPAPAIVKKQVAKGRAPKVSYKAGTGTGGSAKGDRVGQFLPEVSLLSDEGKHVSTETLVTSDAPGLILFTYPRANTGGCTTQATGLSALAGEAKSKGFTVVGCSYDSVKSQATWKAKKSLNMMLLCDTLEVGFLKGIGAHKAPKSVARSLFIVRRGANGRAVIEVSMIGVSPKACVAFVSEFLAKETVEEGKDE